MVAVRTDVFLLDWLHFVLADFAEEGHVFLGRGKDI